MERDFLRGIGSAIDLFPCGRTEQINLPTHSDEEAIRKDWEQVGKDLIETSKMISYSKSAKPILTM